MALPTRFAGHKLSAKEPAAKTVNTIELYLDYVCPFSAKMFKTLYSSVFPKFHTSPYAHNVVFIFRNQIQPWHPSSTLVHEASLAVEKLDLESFWEYSNALMENQKEFFDVHVVNETRNQTYGRLARLAGGLSAKAVQEGKVMDMLRVPDKPAEDGSLNVGNAVTDDLKLAVKMARVMGGVHVSPTVVFNGVPEGSISSNFTGEQWDEWLRKNCS